MVEVLCIEFIFKRGGFFIKKLYFSSFAVVFLFFGGMGNVYASDLDLDELPEGEREETKERSEEVVDYLSHISDLKAKKNSLENDPDDLSTNDIESQEIDNEIKNLNDEIKELEDGMEENIGVRDVDIDEEELIDEIGLFNSAPSDVSVSHNFREDVLNGDGRYIAEVSWEWNNSNWNSITGTGEVGGLDGVAIGLNNDISVYNENLNLYSSYDGENVTSGTTVNRERAGDGYAWTYQDRVIGTGTGTGQAFNAGSGTAILYIDFPQGMGSSTELYINKTHTWSNAAVTGVSVSGGIPSFSISNVSNSWSDSVSWIVD